MVTPAGKRESGQSELLLLSGGTAPELMALLDQLIALLRSRPDWPLRAFALTYGRMRPSTHRLALVVTSRDELDKYLLSARTRLTNVGVAFRVAAGLYYGQ